MRSPATFSARAGSRSASPPATTTGPCVRREGFLAAMGREVPTAVVHGAQQPGAGAAGAVRPAGPRRSPLRAVFCSSDGLAQGVLTEARARGMRVPEDLAVVRLRRHRFRGASRAEPDHRPHRRLGHRRAGREPAAGPLSRRAGRPARHRRRLHDRRAAVHGRVAAAFSAPKPTGLPRHPERQHALHPARFEAAQRQAFVEPGDARAVELRREQRARVERTVFEGPVDRGPMSGLATRLAFDAPRGRCHPCDAAGPRPSRRPCRRHRSAATSRARCRPCGARRTARRCGAPASARATSPRTRRSAPAARGRGWCRGRRCRSSAARAARSSTSMRAQRRDRPPAVPPLGVEREGAVDEMAAAARARCRGRATAMAR